MYFKNFPKILYDIDNADGSYGLVNVVDITKSVRVIKKVLENITLYDEYDMMDGETIEIVAEKVYGNAELHWIIMLINEKYDYLRDFPLSQEELEDYIDEKYGIEKLNIRQYELNGLVSAARATMKVPAYILGDEDSNVKIKDFLIGSNGVAKVESIDILNSTLTILIDKGTFIAGEPVQVSGFRLDEDTSVEPSVFEWKFRGRNNFVLGQNALNIPSAYQRITNYEHEIRLNESKRRIKLISPELIQQFIREFESLMSR